MRTSFRSTVLAVIMLLMSVSAGWAIVASDLSQEQIVKVDQLAKDIVSFNELVNPDVVFDGDKVNIPKPKGGFFTAVIRDHRNMRVHSAIWRLSMEALYGDLHVYYDASEVANTPPVELTIVDAPNVEQVATENDQLIIANSWLWFVLLSALFVAVAAFCNFVRFNRYKSNESRRTSAEIRQQVELQLENERRHEEAVRRAAEAREAEQARQMDPQNGIPMLTQGMPEDSKEALEVMQAFCTAERNNRTPRRVEPLVLCDVHGPRGRALRLPVQYRGQVERQDRDLRAGDRLWRVTYMPNNDQQDQAVDAEWSRLVLHHCGNEVGPEIADGEVQETEAFIIGQGWELRPLGRAAEVSENGDITLVGEPKQMPQQTESTETQQQIDAIITASQELTPADVVKVFGPRGSDHIAILIIKEGDSVEMWTSSSTNIQIAGLNLHEDGRFATYPREAAEVREAKV